MSDIFQAYIRKPFEVFAVQATPFNLAELAKESGGTLKHNGQKEGNLSRDYVQLRVDKPLTQRQTELHVGDWLVHQGRKYKSYPDKQFQATFELRNNSAGPEEFRRHVKPPRNKKNRNRGPRQGQQGSGSPSPANMPKKRTTDLESRDAAFAKTEAQKKSDRFERLDKITEEVQVKELAEVSQAVYTVDETPLQEQIFEPQSEERVPETGKAMTLDELNKLPGDPRSAQEIMEENRQAGGGQAYPGQTPGEQYRGEA